jgi:hypothetical protein
VLVARHETSGRELFILPEPGCLSPSMCHCPKRSRNKSYGFYVGHRAKPGAVDSAFDVSALIPLSCGSSCTQPHPPLGRHSSRRNAKDALNQLNGSGKSQFLRWDAERSHQRPIGFIVLLWLSFFAWACAIPGPALASEFDIRDRRASDEASSAVADTLCCGCIQGLWARSPNFPS